MTDARRTGPRRPASRRQPTTGSQPTGRVQPARRIALEVITAVRESEAYANLLLPVKLDRAKLSTQDAALATELTYGTLRRQGYYDAVIALAADRPVTEIDPPLLDVLRLGAHQLLSMRVAAHAAVDESVSLARQVGSGSGSGFVNGVLRTITRTDADRWHERVMERAGTGDDRLALEYSHPVWVVRAFRRSLAAEGREHELEELLAADNVAPRVNLAALPGLSEPDELAPAVRSAYSPLGAESDGGDPAGIELVRSGRARVQDEGSQLAALALSRARPVTTGELWLDLCAGPGGKTAVLGAEAAVGGATVLANEVVPARAELVRKAVAALPHPPEVVVSDGTDIGSRHPQRYDRILLDAPCTGLGALRRRPEARWRKSPKDVAALTTLQSALLSSALDALKPGGVLAYVTCSPHLAETRAVVDAVVSRSGGAVSKIDTAAVLAGVTREPLELGGSSGPVQLWPHRHGTDAMFICLLTTSSTPTPNGA